MNQGGSDMTAGGQGVTMVEERLRRELPELADALAGPPRIPLEPAGPWSRRRVLASGLVAAGVGALALVGYQLADDEPDELVESGGDPAAPTGGAGVWATLPAAPIEPRAHAVAAWTGSEAIFWAGSSLDRLFAYADGAAYNPARGTWRTLEVPGWGHPGLAGSVLDGTVYAVAKGGGTALDFTSGTWTELPPLPGTVLAATVAADGAVWGLGPVSTAGTDGPVSPELNIARLDRDSRGWTQAPPREVAPDEAATVDGISRLETSVVATGTEIVVWGRDGTGLAFDLAAQTWRRLPALEHPSGSVSESVATVAAGDVVVLASVQGSEPARLALARLAGESWTWTDLRAAPSDLGRVTVTAAGSWVVLLDPGSAPITVHPGSGRWVEHRDAPLGDIAGASAVWTGESVVMWGGVPTAGEGDGDGAEGAVWYPPTS